MSNLIPFDFDGSAVRVVLRNSDPWFVAKDVCGVLEIVNHKDAVSRLEDDERRGSVVPTPLGGRQEMTCVSESGLYSLIFTSRKEEAKRFRKWVTGEVLPSIRKTGGYGTNPATAPAAFVLIKPALRAQALHCAVQTAKMQGGSEEDIERLFERYCVWMAPAKNTGQLQLLSEDGYEIFARWAKGCIEESATHNTRAGELYQHYRQWAKEYGENRLPSMKRWGSWMRGLFDGYKSGVIRYRVQFVDNFQQ